MFNYNVIIYAVCVTFKTVSMCVCTVNFYQCFYRTIQEPISIGKALTGTQVKVVNEQGETLTSGTGHIWIGSVLFSI